MVRYAGRVFDEKELKSLVSSSLDFWLTSAGIQKNSKPLSANLPARSIHSW